MDTEQMTMAALRYWYHVAKLAGAITEMDLIGYREFVIADVAQENDDRYLDALLTYEEQ